MTMPRSRLAYALPIIALLALATCAFAQQEAPATFDEMLERVKVLSYARQKTEAFEAASALVEAHPERAEAWYWRGSTRELPEENEAAAADFRRALELAPDYLDAQFSLAYAEARPQEDWEGFQARMRAVADRCADAIGADADNAGAYRVRAAALSDLGEFDAAGADAQRAVELAPDDMDARLQLALQLMLSRDHEAAIEHLQAILERYPEHVTALVQLGRAYMGLDRYDEALQCWEEAARVAPDQAQPHQMRAFLLWWELHDPQAALEACDDAIAAEPNSHLGYVQKAEILMEGLGDTEGALHVVNQGFEALDDPAGLLLMRALLLMDLARWDEALADLDAALVAMPYAGQSYYVRAQVLYELGRYDEAWRDVHAAEEALWQFGWTPGEEFLDKLREAMPEPPANTGDAQQTTNEGN